MPPNFFDKYLLVDVLAFYLSLSAQQARLKASDSPKTKVQPALAAIAKVEAAWYVYERSQREATIYHEVQHNETVCIRI